jgi:hypothetical protein
MRGSRGLGFALGMALLIGAMWGTTAFAQGSNGPGGNYDWSRVEQRHNRSGDRWDVSGNWGRRMGGRGQYGQACSQSGRGHQSAWNDNRGRNNWGGQNFGRGRNQGPRNRHSRGPGSWGGNGQYQQYQQGQQYQQEG